MRAGGIAGRHLAQHRQTVTRVRPASSRPRGPAQRVLGFLSGGSSGGDGWGRAGNGWGQAGRKDRQIGATPVDARSWRGGDGRDRAERRSGRSGLRGAGARGGGGLHAGDAHAAAGHERYRRQAAPAAAGAARVLPRYGERALRRGHRGSGLGLRRGPGAGRQRDRDRAGGTGAGQSQVPGAAGPQGRSAPRRGEPRPPRAVRLPPQQDRPDQPHLIGRRLLLLRQRLLLRDHPDR